MGIDIQMDIERESHIATIPEVKYANIYENVDPRSNNTKEGRWKIEMMHVITTSEAFISGLPILH